MELTKETLEARVRETPLVDRLKECRQRIGKMCSEGRPPRMCIPVQHDDDDFFISTTLADAQATVEALQRERDEDMERIGKLCEQVADLERKLRIEDAASRVALDAERDAAKVWKSRFDALKQTTDADTEMIRNLSDALTQLQALVRALLDSNEKTYTVAYHNLYHYSQRATLDATTTAPMGSNILEEDIGKSMMRSKGGDGE